jgi:hypothetical protein
MEKSIKEGQGPIRSVEANWKKKVMVETIHFPHLKKHKTLSKHTTMEEQLCQGSCISLHHVKPRYRFALSYDSMV